MWERVEEDVGEARERELAEIYFRPAIEKEAQLTRHHNTTKSAHEIIRRIMKNDPAPLLIQRELVDEGRGIESTSAGEAVNEELHALIKKHEAEMNDLREEMRQALKEKDDWMRNELDKETRRLGAEMEMMRESMEERYREERAKMEEQIRQMQGQRGPCIVI